MARGIKDVIVGFRGWGIQIRNVKDVGGVHLGDTTMAPFTVSNIGHSVGLALMFPLQRVNRATSI